MTNAPLGFIIGAFAGEALAFGTVALGLVPDVGPEAIRIASVMTAVGVFFSVGLAVTVAQNRLLERRLTS